jgi:hypothetical protein
MHTDICGARGPNGRICRLSLFHDSSMNATPHIYTQEPREPSIVISVLTPADRVRMLGERARWYSDGCAGIVVDGEPFEPGSPAERVAIEHYEGTRLADDAGRDLAEALDLVRIEAERAFRAGWLALGKATHYGSQLTLDQAWQQYLQQPDPLAQLVADKRAEIEANLPGVAQWGYQTAQCIPHEGIHVRPVLGSDRERQPCQCGQT